MTLINVNFLNSVTGFSDLVQKSGNVWVFAYCSEFNWYIKGTDSHHMKIIQILKFLQSILTINMSNTWFKSACHEMKRNFY